MGYNTQTCLWEGYIYKISSLITGKEYVGQTMRSVEIRIKEHFDKTHVQGANKYFDNIDDFVFETIETITSNTIDELYQLLDNREIYWISYYNTFLDGYNMTLGGQRENRNVNVQSIIQYDRLGNFIASYRNFTEASISTGANRTRISKSCKSGDNYFLANNFLFRFEDDALTNKDIYNIRLKYPLIYQYSLTGILLNTFNSCADAALYLKNTYNYNVESRNISKVCDKDNATLYNFVWRKYPHKYEDYNVKIKRKIEQRDIITGELLGVYDSIIEAAKDVGANSTQIGQILLKKKGYYTSGGYYWCYENEFDLDEFNLISRKLHTPIKMMNSKLEIIKVFNSVKEAHIFLNGAFYGCSNIYHVLNKNIRAYGYYWRTIENDSCEILYLNENA